ncbi:cation/H(+) antiporter 15-like [Mercurialis annua]|uniref:cation/H(+) antiporter 15-like n=1 Tax=Mercurialis annua TaxID=3986 RepID=UPI00215EB99A|nr:cation/H(+) antiporter 15-like [Mercurialis annua]
MEKNITVPLDHMVCRKLGYLTSWSLWENDYALSPTIILTIQLVVIFFTSRFVDVWLRQLGQTSIVSQIVAGIFLGPSLLGQNGEAARTLFPVEGYMTLATFAAFGNMFYHFLVAVKIDPIMILKPGRVAMYLAASAFSITMFFTFILALFMRKHIVMDPGMHNSIALIAMSQAFTGISVVSYLVNELKLQNTDVGRLALSVAVFSDALNILMVTLSFVAGVVRHHIIFIWAVFTTIGVVFFIVLVIRPVILITINRLPLGKPVDQKYVSYIILTTLFLGFISEVIGQHYIFGPSILGLVVPEGPPLGAALESRLETFVMGFLYPTYLAISGLQTNILEVKLKEMWIVGTVVAFGVVVRTVTLMSAGSYMNISLRDSFVLSMILSSKGILEISIYNFWIRNKILRQEEFSMCIISVVATTAIVTPLIRYIYDPTINSQPVKRNTLQHSKHDTELRMLVCIHNPENVPTIINLLEVSNATEDSPIAAIALVLVELAGRSVPILISNDTKSTRNETATVIATSHALKMYEQKNEGYTTVQSYTSISSYSTMHLDIFRTAIERRASILIMPFHKQWAIDGNVETISPSIRRMNCKVLEKAPCSIGILVDRGILKGTSNIPTIITKFNVVVIFLGGPDDAESLAYGARMARHESVKLTVIRFLLFGSENSIERKRDSELMFQYKQMNMGNERFLYVEEVVRDGVGLSQCIRKIVNLFDLILVGRYHQDSPLFLGLEDWSECPELGLIGDMLASPDFKMTASVLVIQQQRIRASKRESRALVVPEDNSWSITMDKNLK